MFYLPLGVFIRRSRSSPSAPESAPALRIVARGHAAEIRMAAEARRLGGLPSPRDPRSYEFACASRRDLALDALRRTHGWTAAEAG